MSLTSVLNLILAEIGSQWSECRCDCDMTHLMAIFHSYITEDIMIRSSNICSEIPENILNFGRNHLLEIGGLWGLSVCTFLA